MILILSHDGELRRNERQLVAAYLFDRGEDLGTLPPGRYTIFEVQEVGQVVAQEGEPVLSGTTHFPPASLLIRNCDGSLDLITDSGACTLRAPAPPPPESVQTAA